MASGLISPNHLLAGNQEEASYYSRILILMHKVGGEMIFYLVIRIKNKASSQLERCMPVIPALER